jgi:hypothetical protein
MRPVKSLTQSFSVKKLRMREGPIDQTLYDIIWMDMSSFLLQSRDSRANDSEFKPKAKNKKIRGNTA